MIKDILTDIFNELLSDWYNGALTIINDRSENMGKDWKELEKDKKDIENRFKAALEEPMKIYSVGSRDKYEPYTSYGEHGNYSRKSKAEKVVKEKQKEIEDEWTEIYIDEIEINTED